MTNQNDLTGWRRLFLLDTTMSKLRVFEISLTILLIFVPGFWLSAQTTEFAYQGNISNGTSPANGLHDFEFALFDQGAGGNQVGPIVGRPNLLVSNGLFSVNLDFGNVFPGADRILEVRVRFSGAANFVTLAPRQKIASSPYSVKSLVAETAISSSNFSGSLVGDVTGTQSNTTVAKLKGMTLSSATPTNGLVVHG